MTTFAQTRPTPPIYGHTERKSLFQLVSEQVVACARDGLSARNLSTTLRHCRLLFTEQSLLLWMSRVD